MKFELEQKVNVNTTVASTDIENNLAALQRSNGFRIYQKLKKSGDPMNSNIYSWQEVADIFFPSDSGSLFESRNIKVKGDFIFAGRWMDTGGNGGPKGNILIYKKKSDSVKSWELHQRLEKLVSEADGWGHHLFVSESYLVTHTAVAWIGDKDEQLFIYERDRKGFFKEKIVKAEPQVGNTRYFGLLAIEGNTIAALGTNSQYYPCIRFYERNNDGDWKLNKDSELVLRTTAFPPDKFDEGCCVSLSGNYFSVVLRGSDIIYFGERNNKGVWKLKEFQNDFGDDNLIRYPKFISIENNYMMVMCAEFPTSHTPGRGYILFYKRNSEKKWERLKNTKISTQYLALNTGGTSRSFPSLNGNQLMIPYNSGDSTSDATEIRFYMYK